MKLTHLPIIICILAATFTIQAQQKAPVYEFKIITSVESVVPMGLGRSRMIETEETRDYKNFTSNRTAENDKRNKSNREDIRIKNFEETKLLNFYNIAGIRFQNIVANDVIITSKLNEMSEEGWELNFVSSAVESDAGKGDGNGLFITRYIFKRLKQQ